MSAPPSDDDWVQVVRYDGRLYIHSYREYQTYGQVANMWRFPDRYYGRPAWNTLMNVRSDYALVRRSDLPGVLAMERARLAMEGT